VQVRPPGLAGRLAVPVEPDRGEVGELAADVLGAAAVGVEVLDPDEKAGSDAPCEQPGEQRRAQVAEMKLAGR